MSEQSFGRDVVARSFDEHARSIGATSGNFDDVLRRVDRNRARRRRVAVVGSTLAVGAGLTGLALVANPTGGRAPADSTSSAGTPDDGSWRCQGLIRSDDTGDYYSFCEPMAFPAATSVAISAPVASTVTDPFIASTSTVRDQEPSATTTPPATTATSAEPIMSARVENFRCTGLLGFVGADAYYDSCEAIGSMDTTPPTTVSTPIVVGTAPSTSEPRCELEQVYIVRAGDTLTSIAELYDDTIDRIADYNSWPEGLGHLLLIGDEVKIPPQARIVGDCPPDTDTAPTPTTTV
jgi:hypothetical protein